jgi:hypothetical protein
LNTNSPNAPNILVPPRRLDHRLTAFIGPDPGKVFQEGSAEDRSRTNGSAIQNFQIAQVARASN